MKFALTMSLAALSVAVPALADPTTRTVTVDGPKYDATRTTVRDREAGTLARDTSVTRDSDGSTATRSYDRTKTDDGVTASGSATGFNGKTRSFEYQRVKTENGSTATGTATGANGGTLNYSGSRERTGTGFTANQNVTNGQGRTLYNRDVAQSRADGQVTRSVDVTRAAGFRPGKVAHPGIPARSSRPLNP